MRRFRVEIDLPARRVDSPANASRVCRALRTIIESIEADPGHIDSENAYQNGAGAMVAVSYTIEDHPRPASIDRPSE
jgi:hypothetical protein